jgi:uncharacterized protein YraI
MKRLFLLFVIILSGVQMTGAQTSSLQTSTTVQANLRSGPGTEWRIVGTVPAGTTILLDGQAFDGSWARGITSGGIIGWIYASNLAASAEQIAALRPVYVETPFTLSAPAQQGGTSGGSGGAGRTVTATTRVNMRSGPSTEYRRVGGLEAGATLNIDGRDASGTWVRGINQAGVIGWVYASYLSISSGEVASLPVVTVDTPFGLSAPGAGSSTTSREPTSEQTDAPLPAPVVSTAPVSGFSYGGHVEGFSDAAANWMRVAGMTWVKRQVRYIDGQDAGGLSGMINSAHARGFRIVVGVIGIHPGDLLSAGYYDRYASFVAGVAGLGADAIEIWNEPNIDREWPAGQINPAEYTRFLSRAYNAIKAVNRNTLVVSGAPAPTGFFGGCSGAGCDDNAFVAGMAAAGAANYMDCLGIHYNEGIVPPSSTSGDPRGNSGHYTRYLRSMMDTYNNAFGGRRPLCFTELGYLSPEGYGPLPPNFAWAVNVTVAQQASWLDQAIDITRRSGRVRLVIIWNVDFTGYGADPVGGYAMIRPGGGCPACEALGQ